MIENGWIEMVKKSKSFHLLFSSGLLKEEKIIMNQDVEICHCMGIMKSEIVKAIQEKKLRTFEEVQDTTEAGTVCGGCQDDIEDILKEINA